MYFFHDIKYIFLKQFLLRLDERSIVDTDENVTEKPRVQLDEKQKNEIMNLRLGKQFTANVSLVMIRKTIPYEYSKTITQYQRFNFLTTRSKLSVTHTWVADP